MEQILNSFIVRIDDKGKEVDKPTSNKYKGNGKVAIGATNQLTKEWAYYYSLKKVIKLPTLIEFMSDLDENSPTRLMTNWVESIQYKTFLQTQLSEELFVNELVEPICQSSSCHNETQNFCDCFDHDMDEFQKAEDRVLFINEEIYKQKHPQAMGVYLPSNRITLDHETINQALNNNVVLYMKIK